MTPKFFYFDMGNVLLRFDHEIACRQMGQVAGISADRVRQIVFDSGLERRYERGEVTSREFYDIFCRESGTDGDYEALYRAGGAIFEINVPLIPIVVQLRAVQHRLGILSNTCEAHWDYCSSGRYSVISKLFDVVALSYVLGALKPERAIFEAAARLAQARPQEIFYVDDRNENVAAARDCGFDAVLYTTPARLAADIRKRGVRINY